MNNYYEISGTIDSEEEILFGSFERADCVYELEAEKEQWKEEGYKKLRIKPKKTSEEASAEVYEMVTSSEIFQRHAPDFNFELNEEELVQRGLDCGFLSRAGKDKYIISKDYLTI